ncbi:hypothetical protein [Streptomyces sp. NPDC017949]|uniref:hypothetical protein n=1 Tax=Streptomyces sp. NPDC017949 TaxID=3365020 RepID=UPI0037B6DB5A
MRVGHDQDHGVRGFCGHRRLMETVQDGSQGIARLCDILLGKHGCDALGRALQSP